MGHHHEAEQVNSNQNLCHCIGHYGGLKRRNIEILGHFCQFLLSYVVWESQNDRYRWIITMMVKIYGGDGMDGDDFL